MPSIYIANSSSLALFASGRTSGLIVECGAGITSSVPVFEGLALAHASTTLEFGGQDVSANIRNALADRGVQVDSGYARMLKEKMAFVNVAGRTGGQEQSLFSLPDGTDVSVETDLFGRCTEQLFVNDSVEPAGLSAQVFESIQLCDDTLMKEFSHNVVVSGGSSMIAGMVWARCDRGGGVGWG